MSVSAVLALLDADSLTELADALGLAPPAGATDEGLRRAIADSDATTLASVLAGLPRESLRALCRQLHLDVSGAGRAPWVQALSRHFRDAGSSGARTVSVEVLPRQPRLAWQGMDQQEAVTAVPAQVVEIVRPGRARALDTVAKKEVGALFDVNVRECGPRAASEDEPNRIIWTNDNLVALRTLLDERDPRTKDYRYRGKVDLVYIDPPFMVNSDFRADNAISIDLDASEHIAATKEPSLVETLAYRDTWRNGLDSFLIMLRRRLELLKELLAPTGSIYVHLDWHAVHYVKVVMDEVFGYDNFKNEIVWQRTTAHNDPKQFGRVNDRLLYYAVSSDSCHFRTVYGEYSSEQLSRYGASDSGGRYTGRDLTAPGIRYGETGKAWRGMNPTNSGRHWSRPPAELEELLSQGRILLKKDGTPRLDGLKVYLTDTEGPPVQDVWTDIGLAPTSSERLGYPTQKPVALIERIISASCPPGGLVLDCFMGSGTTLEAAERLDRRWIGIDAGKYATHLARKRLIQLHGTPRAPEKAQYDYKECEHCGNIERKDKKTRSTLKYDVKPFTMENMGVYQRAESWQDFQQHRNVYRDELVRVFGGEPVDVHPLLHGKKGRAWVHIGPLDGPIASHQVWEIARAAADTDVKGVSILSADFDTLSAGEKSEVLASCGVHVEIRVIPASAIDEVKRRIEAQRSGGATVIESMAIPAFYAPLSIRLGVKVDGRVVRLTLERCEVDMESFLASQRPIIAPMEGARTEAQRTRIRDEQQRWADRQSELIAWLDRATSWQNFVDFWSVDTNYGARVGDDRKPIFQTDWQSFRERGAKGPSGSLVFTAEARYEKPGVYRLAARVTDVFGNDGIATVSVTVK